jgi:NAD(P)-dependent dehydrogenase (short-subunit alcohol dehydrogenase family)
MTNRWSAKQMPKLQGKTALVTGANRGLGYWTALELARAGADVILCSRTAADEAKQRILSEAPNAAVIATTLDLASLASVRSCAQQLIDRGATIDILVNNAGVMALPKRELTEDGFERQFGINHLGHFALTALLLPTLLKATQSRVVTLSSTLAAFGSVKFDNLQSEKKYSVQGAYEVSKLANLMFMQELSRRAPETLLSVGAHPGIASTGIAQSGPPVWIGKLLGQDPAQGALPQLYAASASDVRSGDYFGPSGWFEMSGPPKRVQIPKQALDEVVAKQLWERSEELTKATFNFRH